MKRIPANTKHLMLLIAFLPVSVFLFPQTEFDQHVVTESFTKGADVIAVDLDKDGSMDIVATNSHSTAQVAWWQNNGGNEFTKIVILDNLGSSRSVRAADVNNDQEIDLVVAIYADNSIIYLENDGNENFTEHTVDDNFIGAHTIDIKDVNDDGHPDVLCSGFDYHYHNGEIAWWESDGGDPITWTKHLVSERFQQSPFVFGEDMDGDNDLDILACGELNDEILWWENDGNQNFTSHMIDSLINGIHTVLSRDVDLDGDMDVLAAACIGSRVAWYENNGSQSFVKHDLGYLPGALWLDAADLDNDGDNDLFAAPQGGNRLVWWENPGNEEFIKHYFKSTFTQSFCVVPVLMDEDNDIDLVAIGWQSNRISWFENKLESMNLLDSPESVVFDQQNDRYLVSNWGNGNIIEIGSTGVQKYFVNLAGNTAGLHIAGDKLYASSNNNVMDGLIGFDLPNGELYCRIDIAGKELINDITSDNDGNLYVTDSEAHKIYRIRPEDSTCTVFVGTGLTAPNGIYFDGANNRLLVLSEGLPYKPIVAVDLADSSISVIVETKKNGIDGLTADSKGNYYFSSWTDDCIYKYDQNFTDPPEAFSCGHYNPADIYCNQLDNVIAVPNFGGDTLELVPVGTTSIPQTVESNTGLKAIPNPFSGQTEIEYRIESDSHIMVSIVDLQGQLVETLFEGQLNPGIYKSTWEPKTNDSFGLQPGIYFCKFIAGNQCSTIKLIKTN